MPPAARFASLDGLRGLAAIAVLLFHLDRGYMPGGHLAVDFFFCLSGFVIALNYRERLRAGMGPGHFMALRLARLYPMMLAGGLLAMALLGAAPGILLLLPEGNAGAYYPGNPPFWSLTAELAVNLAFALVLVRLHWRWTMLACLAGAALLTWLVLASPVLRIGGLAEVGVFHGTALGGLARAVFAFTLGLLLCAGWHRLGRPRRHHPLALVIAFALIALFVVDPAAGRGWWDLACALVLLPLLTWAAICVELPFERACRALGDLSYPLYCLHVPILLALDRYVGLALWQALAIVPLAWAVDRFYDQPVRRHAARLVTRAHAAISARRPAAT